MRVIVGHSREVDKRRAWRWRVAAKEESDAGDVQQSEIGESVCAGTSLQHVSTDDNPAWQGAYGHVKGCFVAGRTSAELKLYACGHGERDR